MAIDEVAAYNGDRTSTHGNDENSKRQLCLEESDDTSDRPPKKPCYTSNASTLNDKVGSKRRKKEKREEVDWKKHGHLPRPSTKRKYVNNSLEWKTPFTISDLQMKFGGYSSKSSRFQNVPDVQSLDEAIALGLVLVKSSSL
jgi:hypothetical protein